MARKNFLGLIIVILLLGSAYFFTNYQIRIEKLESDFCSDCDSLYSWEYYDGLGDSSIYTSKYTECTPDFDCDSTHVPNIIAELRSIYTIDSPKDYIDAVVDYTVNHFEYLRHYECPRNMVDLFNTNEGNCVDASVFAVTLLRARGIPSRQIAGCVSHEGWQCSTFAANLPLLYDKLGYIDPDEPMGHSWIEIWTPEKGWLISDPTVGDTISKYCVGYHQVEECLSEVCCSIDSSNKQFCSEF